MKKFWLVLLSLGLVIAFSASAFAVDVKFSGEFYAGGMYLDRTTLKKDTATDGPSTAFYFQRLRLQTEFVVAEGVSLITRADIMERAWGAARSTPSATQESAGTASAISGGTFAENENIAFDFAYVKFATPIGLFNAGYMLDNTWGTKFGDTTTPDPCLLWLLPVGPVTGVAKYCKTGENSYTAKNLTQTASDRDADTYVLAAIYAWKSGQAGLLGKYYRYASLQSLIPGVTDPVTWWLVSPYAIAQLGPVNIQAQVYYVWGNYYSTAVAPIGKKDINSLTAYLDATAAFGPVYFGGTFAYLSGDDPGTTDKLEGGVISGGTDWNPCLILWNYDRTYWVGNLAGQSTATNGTTMSNAWFFQGRVGVKPVAKLDIMASVSYAFADKKPKVPMVPTGIEYVSDKYGTEVDLTATYKITNNLSYMLGFGYLFTGDYFKGTTSANIGDDYMVINKLTLTF
jgi:hypothetical protein